MSGLTDLEKYGLMHLFQFINDKSLVVQLANIITKHNIAITDAEEAINIIFLHSPDISTILSKKTITKEILFKYLHKNNCPVKNGFTKISLISRTLEFWKNNENKIFMVKNDNYNETDMTEIDSGPTVSYLSSSSFDKNSQSITVPLEEYESSYSYVNEEEYPINVLARTFSEWFFKRLNENLLSVNDFWLDCEINVRIVIQDDVKENNSTLRENVLNLLNSIKMEYNLFFNITPTHEGVQGRIDVHGLVLVLICGTLHNHETIVGVFESVCSLARDPFSENNWKIKKIQLLLKNTNNNITLPRLVESETMRNILNIPPTSNPI